MKTTTTITLILAFFLNLVASAQPVKTHEGVKVGGIKQWIGAKGEDATKPVLLFLHGGPGFSSRVYSKMFIKDLKKDFIIVQWDQRGSGFTAAWGSEDDPISIDLMHQDTKEVVHYVLQKFNKEKLYLVGFSWGGVLGLQFAHKHPELLHAYISVSAMIHGDASEEQTLQLIREKAKQTNNSQAIEELADVTIPFTSWETLYVQRKWTAYFSNAKSSKRYYPKALFKEWSAKWMSIFLEASRTDYSQIVQKIDCPIYFFLSKKDLVSNYKLAEKLVQDIEADQKEIVWFYNSTHEIPSDEPKKFSAAIIDIATSLSKKEN